jgi:hypothetical protein
MSGYPPNQYPQNQSPQNPSPQEQAQPNQYSPNQYPPNQYPNAPYPPNQYPPNQYPPNAYQQNPYYQQPPYQPNQAGASRYMPCPRCRMPEPQPVKFTWWGGVLGPKMLSHVKCGQCGMAYNGKSGQSNTKGIVIYSVVVFVIFFAIGIAILLATSR